MTLAPYPKYRPSGIEWLGDVPEHWEVKRLKVTSDRPVGGAWGRDPDGRDDVVCVRVADFVRDSLSIVDDPPTIRAIEPRTRTGRLLRSGDLLIEKSGGGEKQVVGAVVMFDSDVDAVCSNFIARLPIVHGYSSRFCLYVHAAAYRGRLTVPSIKQTTGIQNLDLTSYLNLRWCFPPYAEQCEIGSYLDRETEKVGAIVRKQQTLIERLREKRSALITETVTRGLPPNAARAAGLDPNPPRKPSGVEWLGDLPAHWETKRLKYLASINDESLPDTTDPDFEMSYVDIGGVDAVRGIVESEPMTFGGAPSRARRIARDGDSIVSTVRTYLRAIAPVRGAPDDLIVSTGFAVVRPRALCPAYLSYAVRESRFVEAVVARSVGVSYPAVNASEIGKIVVPVPPDGEQQAIADYLDRETAKLDALVAKIETAIERLREYRSAIITAAVTGKVDVRSARRPAPAERGLPNRARRS